VIIAGPAVLALAAPEEGLNTHEVTLTHMYHPGAHGADYPADLMTGYQALPSTPVTAVKVEIRTADTSSLDCYLYLISARVGDLGFHNFDGARFRPPGYFDP